MHFYSNVFLHIIYNITCINLIVLKHDKIVTTHTLFIYNDLILIVCTIDTNFVNNSK